MAIGRRVSIPGFEWEHNLVDVDRMIGQNWDNIGSFSWENAALGWLYRQMCDACRRSGDNANLGGCAYLLQLWMWERIPIGRPERHSIGVRT